MGIAYPTTIGTIHPDIPIDVGDTVSFRGETGTVISFTKTGMVNIRMDGGELRQPGYAVFIAECL